MLVSPLSHTYAPLWQPLPCSISQSQKNGLKVKNEIEDSEKIIGFTVFVCKVLHVGGKNTLFNYFPSFFFPPLQSAI